MIPRPNRTDVEVQLEQMEKLYMRLYPFMIQDFRNKLDHDTFVKEIEAEMALWQGQINSLMTSFNALVVNYGLHVHPVAGPNTLPQANVFAATATPLKPIATTPRDAIGIAFIDGAPPPFTARKPLPLGVAISSIADQPFNVDGAGMSILEGLL